MNVEIVSITDYSNMTTNSTTKDSDKEHKDAPHDKFFKVDDFSNDLFQTTTASSRPYGCRLLWVVASLCLFSVTCLLLYRLIHSYLQYGSYNNISNRFVKRLGLPAFTICDANSMDYKRLVEDLKRTKNEDLMEGLDDLISNLTLVNESVSDLYEFIENHALNQTMDDLNDFEEKYTQNSLARYYGIDPASLLFNFTKHVYKFEQIEKEFDEEMILNRMTELGACMEINDNAKLEQVLPGTNGGFTIDLDAKVANYMPSTPTKGFIVFIRDYGETVLVNSGGYVIAPGTETFLKLSVNKVKRLGKPHGTCEDNLGAFSKRYKSKPRYETVRECHQNHTLKFITEGCGCIPRYFVDRAEKNNKTRLLEDFVNWIEEGKNRRRRPMKKRSIDTDKRLVTNITPGPITTSSSSSSSSSSFTSTSGSPYATSSSTPPQPYEGYYSFECPFSMIAICEKMAAVKVIKKGKEAAASFCPEPCSFKSWDVEITSTQFPPTKAYHEHFMAHHADVTADTSYEYARENVVRLHIFYDQLKVTDITQEKVYEIQSLLAESGGLLDLFIGISLFAVLQAIEIGLAWCIYTCSTWSKPRINYMLTRRPEWSKCKQTKGSLTPVTPYSVDVCQPKVDI